MIWRSDRPLLLGHRGASAHAPDNTLAAFELALAAGADGVELDVRRTADDHMVVFHDPVVDGTPIVDTALVDLRRSRPDIPTLPEALTVLAGAVVNIEIKNSPHEPDFDTDHRLAEGVLQLTADLGVAEQVLISSFNPATVDRLRRLDSEVVLGQLLAGGGDGPAEVQRASDRGVQAVHPHVAQATSGLLAAAADHGVWVVVWTVNEPEKARSLAGAGVAGLISDDPARLLPALAD
jgi:glycerophosphoryl diester phosphodiesterase